MKVKIVYTYSTPKGVKAVFESEMMRAGEAIVLAEDMLKTGRAGEMQFIDTQTHTWTLKEMKKLMEEIQTEPHDIKVYFDGGFDIASGNAGLGCAIYYEQNGKSYRLRQNAFVEQMASNNEAEYAAFHMALQELAAMEVHHLPIIFVGDSKVVIHQLNGDWPCYEPELARWADRIEAKLKAMGIEPEFAAISRKSNREADQLASQALQGKAITSLLEL